MGSPSPILPKAHDAEWTLLRSTSTSSQFRPGSRRRLIASCLMWLVAIVSLFKLIAEQLPRFQKRVPDEPQNVLFQAQETSFARQRERTVVLPATEPNADFCRTVFSLLINGYGTPTVVNWGVKTRKMNHYIKISGFKDLLDQAGSDDDTFVLIDAYDAWAQLPAETFYQQFEQYPTSSGVITAAEKQCGPRPIDAPRCTNQPESPLPNDMYGQFTDVMLSRKLLSKYRSSLKRRDARTNIKFTPFETMRPKFINSGTIVGTRQHLKKLFDAAHSKMTSVLREEIAVSRKGSDQELLALISLEHQQAEKPMPLTADAHVLLFQVITNSARDLKQDTLPNILSKIQFSQKGPLTQVLQQDTSWNDRKILWNHSTKSIASFVHMPGPKANKQLNFWWSQMWWMQPSEREVTAIFDESTPPVHRLLTSLLEQTSESQGYGVRLANGTWLAFADICSGHTDVILQQ